MSHKSHRSGGKFCGSHTTLISIAGIIVDIAVRQDEVSKISLGYIKTSLAPLRGNVRVKFTTDAGSLLLAIRSNIAIQEIRIYTSDVPKTRLHLARSARNERIHISFK